MSLFNFSPENLAAFSAFVESSNETEQAPSPFALPLGNIGLQGLTVPSSGIPSIGSLSDVGSMSGFGVSDQAVSDLLTKEEKRQSIIDGMFTDAPQFNVGTDSFISQQDFDNINSLLSSDEYTGYLDQYTQAMNSEYGDDRTGFYQDNRAVLDELGIGNRFKIAGQYGGEKEYEFNTDTGQFDLIRDNTNSRDNAMIATVADTVVNQTAMSLATMGVGNAFASGISAATGLGTTASTAIGTGIANSVSTALQGGDLEDVVLSGVTSGLGNYAEGITEAASVAGASAEVIAQAELVNDINNVVDIAEAVDSGSVLGAVSAGMNLSGSTGIPLMVDNFYMDTFGDSQFVRDNLGAITDATITFADAQLTGENLEDTLKDTIRQYIESDGGLPDLGFEGEGFALDFGFERPEWLDNLSFDGFPDIDTTALREIGDYILAGASQINRDVIRPVIDGVTEIARDTGIAIDQVIRDIPLTEEQIQEAERRARELASDINRDTIQPLIDTTAGVVRETGREIREAIPDVDVPSLDLPDFSTPDLDVNLPDLNIPDLALPEVNVDLPEIDADFTDLASNNGRYAVNADMSELAKMRTQYGDNYGFDDLFIDNLLKNELLS